MYLDKKVTNDSKRQISPRDFYFDGIKSDIGWLMLSKLIEQFQSNKHLEYSFDLFHLNKSLEDYIGYFMSEQTYLYETLFIIRFFFICI